MLPICRVMSERFALAWCARTVAALMVLALASGAVIAESELSGQDRGNPPKLDPPPKQTQGMRFEWVREGPAEKCGSNCNEWVSAKGIILPETARDFEAFARTRDLTGKVYGAGVRTAVRRRRVWRSAAHCGG